MSGSGVELGRLAGGPVEVVGRGTDDRSAERAERGRELLREGGPAGGAPPVERGERVLGSVAGGAAVGQDIGQGDD